ncbi:hypothetical protein QJS04_geneDACA022660 [Acorus gramineus]|uniref:Uncharacterized protein n=1 Tax=Acorus gramineus TaxID=55184 RepID=A0AAV9B654_ACOGR|nr:hypothetical protein QJS04_geneDACA022660 [Acorus gramineus]
MNRYGRESIAGAGGRFVENNRRGRAGASEEEVELDLFSRSRNGLSATSAVADESDGLNSWMKSGKTSIGSVKLARSGIDDLLSADIGKHDYDWLLTPPGTPQTSENHHHHLFSTAPRSASTAKPASTAKASRFSQTQSENTHSARPVRTSSLTRPSISTSSNTQFTNHYSTNTNNTSTLNTSTTSVTSSRPSTPGRTRSTPPSNPRPSPGPTPRPTTSTPRASTPTRSRPSTASGSRPSTPITRPQTPSVPRPTSRPSTPTRRLPTTPPPNPVLARSSSVGRTRPPAKNGPVSARGSSPGPRARPPPQPIVLPDLPLEPPPNLRTKLPDRPASAGRSRPGAPVMVRTTSNSDRRPSSPTVRGRFPENDNPAKARLNANGSETGAVRRPAKPASVAAESTGFGRTISKKSIDMALRHMDIKNSMGSIRGTSLFPQSVRSAPPKGDRLHRLSDPLPLPVHSNGTAHQNALENGHRSLMRMFEPDPYGSSRYEAMLMKEDTKNMNWLHGGPGDRSDQSPVFDDHRFELLPEPFELL